MSDARQTLTVPNRHHHWIINMDQTHTPFSLHGKWSLNSHGTHMVDIHKSTGDTKFVTLVVMVTASDRMLPPFLIFNKGWEASLSGSSKSFPKTVFMLVKKMHGWMSISWRRMEKMLKLHVFSKPYRIVTILLLDMYHCHMMESVVSIITQLGVEVLCIPGGCMGFCQPINVGINKSFKSLV